MICFPFQAFKALLLIFFFSALTPCRATWSFSETDLQKYLRPVSFDVDVSSGAVVLYEKCTIDLMYKQKIDEGYFIGYTYRGVIKILSKKAFDVADYVKVFPTHPQASSNVRDIKGVTYNVVDGEIEETAMSVKAVRNEKVNEYLRSLRFSLPAVKEGSIIDFSFTIEQPVTVIAADWTFSGKYPRLYSELDCYLSDDNKYVMVTQSPYTFTIFNDKKIKAIDSTVPLAYRLVDEDFSADLEHWQWVRRNVPATEKEPYVNNVGDYEERVLVRIVGNRYAGVVRGILNTWEDLNNIMLNAYKGYADPDDDERKKLQQFNQEHLKLSGDTLADCGTIYRFVRDSFRHRKETLELFKKPISGQLKERAGSGKERNLIAVNLMRASGLKASPVLISAVPHGKMIDTYPAFDNISDVIGQVQIGKDTFYFDASDTSLPFGFLHPNYFNGYSWVVAQNGYAVHLFSERQKERSQIVVRTKSNAIGDFVLEQKITFGKIEGALMRILWGKDTSAIRKSVEVHTENLPFQAKLRSYTISGRNSPDSVLTVTADYAVVWPEGEKNMFQLMMYPLMKENPFTATERRFPIEFPLAQDVFGAFELKLPDGYTAEELPKSVHIKLDDKNLFQYDVSYDPESRTIILRSRLKMETTWFPNTAYPSIRGFYEDIIEQQNASCIISKK